MRTGLVLFLLSAILSVKGFFEGMPVLPFQQTHQACVFKVAEGVYQVREVDHSNMTVIEGKKGIILVDPPASEERAQSALAFYYKERMQKPVKAVILTCQGTRIQGVVPEEGLGKKKMRVFAPEGVSFATDLIRRTGEKRSIDGVRFVFVVAPSEMLFFLPESKALYAAHDACCFEQRIYRLREEKIHHAHEWARYLNQTIEMFGEKAEVVFSDHHSPASGKEQVIDFLEKQRDLYKYLHDQILYFSHQGLRPEQIKEKLRFPKALEEQWTHRGYGSFQAVSLPALAPLEESQKMVAYMGGPSQIISKMKRDYEAGDYRWVARLLPQLLLVEPRHQEAQDLLLQTFEKLALQTEEKFLRGFYVKQAEKLRKGKLLFKMHPEQLFAMPTESLLEQLATRLEGTRAAAYTFHVDLELPDRKERYRLQVKNGVMNIFSHPRQRGDVVLKISRSDWNQLVFGTLTLKEAEESKRCRIEGDRQGVDTLLNLLEG